MAKAWSLVVVALAIYAAVGVVERREKATWAHLAEQQVADEHQPVAPTPILAAETSGMEAIWAAQARAIPGCIRTVRAGAPYSQFDAFPKSDGIVSMFGSPRELFAFQKCMAAAGFELEDTK